MDSLEIRFILITIIYLIIILILNACVSKAHKDSLKWMDKYYKECSKNFELQIEICNLNEQLKILK